MTSRNFRKNLRYVDKPTIFPWTDEWYTVVAEYNARVTEWFKQRTKDGHNYSKCPRKLKYESQRKPARRSTKTSLRASLQPTDLLDSWANKSTMSVDDPINPESSAAIYGSKPPIDCIDDIDSPIQYPSTSICNTIDSIDVGCTSSSDSLPMNNANIIYDVGGNRSNA
ncbi:uncharacterized protein LOC114575041 [Exaiptasia diaphana]|uniref:Uncharacterized protein n=1 Tax=Exaiptasia diaphana TaxID=2652724 RepID=A0A913YK54_EXADI|nr:uncharacterized protein LOC114575041 [Exaiptasia diaphana]